MKMPWLEGWPQGKSMSISHPVVNGESNGRTEACSVKADALHVLAVGLEGMLQILECQGLVVDMSRLLS